MISLLRIFFIYILNSHKIIFIQYNLQNRIRLPYYKRFSMQSYCNGRKLCTQYPILPKLCAIFLCVKFSFVSRWTYATSRVVVCCNSDICGLLFHATHLFPFPLWLSDSIDLDILNFKLCQRLRGGWRYLGHIGMRVCSIEIMIHRHNGRSWFFKLVIHFLAEYSNATQVDFQTKRHDSFTHVFQKSVLGTRSCQQCLSSKEVVCIRNKPKENSRCHNVWVSSYDNLVTSTTSVPYYIIWERILSTLILF